MQWMGRGKEKQQQMRSKQFAQINKNNSNERAKRQKVNDEYTKQVNKYCYIRVRYEWSE